MMLISAKKTSGILLFASLGLVGIFLVGAGIWQLSGGKRSATGPIILPTVTNPVLTITPGWTASPYPYLTSTLPMETPQAVSTLTSTPTAWAACPNSYLSKLYKGIKAKLSEEPPLPNRIREQANTSAKILGMIQPGEIVDIIDGPGCSNQWTWWKIRTADGNIGWTAEGDGTEYWLLPVQP